MANSPILWGPNETAINLQKQSLTSRGELLQNDGPINLIGNNRFENGLTTGWALGTTGTLTNGIPTGTPTFGSGASGNLSISATSTTPISGLYSLAYASSAATTAGNMLHTEELTVSPNLQAKVLTFLYSYQAISGSSNCNFSGTNSNSFGIACWDVTNSQWLNLAGNFSMTQGSGVGWASGTFQTNYNTALVRFVIYNANATAGAATLYFDNFRLGPQTAPIGPVVTDWVSFTPTGSWTANTTYTGKWRRVGDCMEVQTLLTLSGAPTATGLSVNIPSGYSIDAAKILSSNQDTTAFGTGTILDTGTASYLVCEVGYGSATSVVVQTANTAGTYIQQVGVTNTVPITFGNTDTVFIRYTIPISGWSSNVQMSNDTDTRVVAMQTNNSASASLSGSYSIVKYSGTAKDTNAGYNSSTGLYTVQVSGFYGVKTSLNVSGTISANLYLALALYQNGASVAASAAITAASQTNAYVTLNTTVWANAGDTLGPYAQTNITSPAVNSFLSNLNYFNVERLSGPAVVAATESVNARYTNTAGTSFTAATEADLPFATKDYDSHNAYNGTTYICPVSGKYRVTAAIQTTATSYAVSGGLSIFINKNGSRYSRLGITNAGSTTATAFGVNGSDTVNCNAGDALVFRFISDVNTSLSTAAGNNHMTIERVGN